ncbi:DUF4843 domain-containing protein [Pedobacter fastidiosus]|uniref:DUF4843 domain-containing protein n=1 Tax=Pedobacter fastidiosus TaxID=2765361 RepID=A0ABR7KPT1_9SPHI|nr:DUF4843 domain-containing protein [Pedobacter fastidiosus]MBC6109747.1 DUF4843 domain-containing protein [Pedobacter fastidiosus]
MKYSNKTYINIIAICFFAVIIGLFSSCKKNNNVPAASYQDGAYFLVPQVKSTSGVSPVIRHFTKNYSFYFLGDSTILKDTIWLPQVRILGNVSDHDRTLKISVVDTGTTAIAGKHYKLLNYIIPAGSFVSKKLGVEVYRTADLGNNTLKLMLRLEPNTDFPALMVGNSISYDNNYFTGDTYTINISNKLIEPPYWEAFVDKGLGEFSTVKYQFIVDVLPVYFGTNPDTSIDLANYVVVYQSRLSDALEAYNNAHPNDKLKDENGNEIYF